ncbi:MAG: hypothetical protein FJX54_15210 [Alphaproteobacteria bacterium]|nr:hypothetical protein [Alphaproteobacteria bacterium]
MRLLSTALAALLLSATALPSMARAEAPAWTPSPAWFKQKRMEKDQARDRYLDRGTPAGQAQRAAPIEDERVRAERDRRSSAAARLQREDRLLNEQRAMPAIRSQSR